MEMNCQRCDDKFDSGTLLAYCDDCKAWFQEQQQIRKAAQNPQPGMHITGQFLKPDNCPATIHDDVRGGLVCGLCGSDEIDQGYGFAGGYGLGAYNYCCGCESVLDFSEDPG